MRDWIFAIVIGAVPVLTAALGYGLGWRRGWAVRNGGESWTR